MVKTHDASMATLEVTTVEPVDVGGEGKITVKLLALLNQVNENC